jgi:DNA-binding beta-propeller fold protein YncE
MIMNQLKIAPLSYTARRPTNCGNTSILALFASVVLLASGCGDDAWGLNDEASADGYPQEDFDDEGKEESGDDVGEDDGQEDEDNRSFFTVPQISGSFIYAANTETGRVSVVHSSALTIEVVPVGARPTLVQALTSADPQAGSAAILHVDGALAILSTPANGATQLEAYKGTAGANALASSESGRFVVVYHDIDEPITLGPGSDQENVVVDSQSKTRFALSVGLHPYDVSFASDESTLNIHTQDGISVVDLLALSPNSASRLVPVMPGAVNP